MLDVPEFNFTYNDSDAIHAEIAGRYRIYVLNRLILKLIYVELYTYSEEPEFVWNAEAFNILFQAKCKR